MARGARSVALIREHGASALLCGWCGIELVRGLRAMLDALTGMNDPSGSGRLQAPDCVELVLVHDAAMAARNARHLGRGGPTNVLAFPASGDVPGCLILSLDTALREAVLYGQAPSRHVMWLLAHGAGHLVGLDHGDAMDRLCREAFSRGLAALGA